MLAIKLRFNKMFSIAFKIGTPFYIVSQKKMDIPVTIQYRIIIVLLFGRALSPARFDNLMAVVHQKAI